MRIAVALAAGILLYFVLGLNPTWQAAWIAPIPLLLLLDVPRRQLWLFAILAASMGLASLFSYLRMIASAPIALSLILLQAATWGLVLRRMQVVTQGSRHWLIPFAYPVLWAGLDTVIKSFSPHGSWGSLAYTQMEFLPVIQIASLTGTAGVVFVLSLFASTVATFAMKQFEIDRPALAYGLPAAIIATALGFGYWRLAQPQSSNHVTVAIAADDRFNAPWGGYEDAARQAAGKGAKIFVMPEKIQALDLPEVAALNKKWSAIAQHLNMHIVTGITVVQPGRKDNAAMLFSSGGAPIAIYGKHHMVPGLESDLTPGKELVIRNAGALRVGLAICKDMDFPYLLRDYANAGVDLMLVPAWDFSVDAWMHSRMAILRGVENGFTIVRSAREGLLTVTDRCGRVLEQAQSGTGTLLIAAAPIEADGGTFYSIAGDWFGWLCVALSLASARFTRRE